MTEEMTVLHTFFSVDGKQYRIVYYPDTPADSIATFYQTFNTITEQWYEQDHSLDDFGAELVYILKSRDALEATMKKAAEKYRFEDENIPNWNMDQNEIP